MEGSLPEQIRQEHFKRGTYRIRSPGHYVLEEDVAFDPDTGELSWSGLPADSQEYPLLEGYLLGFFAAITIEVSARNVTIMNCRIGRSSHHSIHGNDNEGVTLINTEMYDFEVAGVSLNGASRVRMDSVDIGPSLRQTFKAGMSQAIFLDHLANTLMVRDHAMHKALKELKIKLRGTETKVKDVFTTLHDELKDYIKGKKPKKNSFDISTIVGTGEDLPDGSAIYGLLLHRSGVAINQLGFCADDGDIADKRVADIRLNNINIYDLAVKVAQIVNPVVDGKIVAGPAGDVFQITKAWDPDDCYKYVGNSFTDAQLAVGLVRNEMAAQEESQHRLSFFFGGSHMPQQVLDWAAGKLSCSESEQWAKSFIEGSGGNAFTCVGDAMNHFNKGAIGMRLGFQEDVEVENVMIGNLDNQGLPDADPYCRVDPGPYTGLDVRGVSLKHMKDLTEFNVEKAGDFTSTDSSRVFSDLSALQMRGDDIQSRGNL